MTDCSSSCSFPRRGLCSPSVWLQLSWRRLQPLGWLCPWWGPSFTAGGASWLTAASLTPSATPASPTSVLLIPRASTWVHHGRRDKGLNRVFFFFFPGYSNSWLLPQPRQRGVAGTTCLLCVCVCRQRVWEEERLWVSASSVTQVSHTLQLVAQTLTRSCCWSSGSVLSQTDCHSRSASRSWPHISTTPAFFLARPLVCNLSVTWPFVWSCVYSPWVNGSPSGRVCVHRRYSIMV